MNMHLAALGWVTDMPQGNRLRWHYPFDTIVGGNYVGLPQSVTIERAPLKWRARLKSPDVFTHAQASVSYPYDWWAQHGDITFPSFLPVGVFKLAGSVQAVSFTWRGGVTRLLFFDRFAKKVVAERSVTDGEDVYVEAAMLDRIVVLQSGGRLEDLRTLDLFADRGLDWEPLAEIAVAPSFQSMLSKVEERYEAAPTLSAAEWRELATLASTAQTASPTDATPGDLSAWENLALVLGLRWEFALLGGFGFFDGPRARVCALDQITGDLLAGPGATMMAYRVRERGGRKAQSNIAVCPAALASPLSAPGSLQYLHPEVRLREEKSASVGTHITGLSLTGAMRNFSPVSRFDADYDVRLTMRWQHSDPRAIGVEVHEEVSKSAITGDSAVQRTLASRSREVDDIPPDGSVARSFDVAFPDVLLRARARAIDAWDRVSAQSGWTPLTSLILRHEPPAPPLAAASYDNGTVRITRALGVPNVPDWEPDALVGRVAGRVFIYRQSAAPRLANVTAGVPLPASGDVQRVPITGATNLADFIGGSLSAGGFTQTVLDAVGAEVHVSVPNNGGAVELFPAGPARLAQNPRHAALWTKVADFPAAALPPELVFSDPRPAAVGIAVESYVARIFYFGRLGPAGGVVRALRHPVVPVMPPPFTVEFLGVDFYHRTMLKISFTTPVTSGHYSVWWAGGNVSPADLLRRGTAGLYGEQEAQNGAILYDVISLPVPQHVNRLVTIGVQRVIPGGARSDFLTVPVSVPALV